MGGDRLRAGVRQPADLLFGGRLGDLIGRKVTFLTGVIGFAAASAVGGASTSFVMLVAARAAQGAFGALLAPAALSILSTTFSNPKERGRAFGVYGAIVGAGGAIGLVLGGILTEYLSWRWSLYVNLIFAGLAGTGAVLLLRRALRHQVPGWTCPASSSSPPRCSASSTGSPTPRATTWHTPSTWGFLAAGVALLAGFAFWQARAASPLPPPRVVADRNRGAAYLALLITGAGMFGIFLFLTYYLQQTLGYSPVISGVAFLPMIAMVVVGANLANVVLLPRLIDILGEPLKPDQLWNPDAVLRVEDIHHRPDTRDRLDKAAATQLVFEDAMIHVVDHLLRATASKRLVLTGGVALNAIGNMRLLEHFDEAWFSSAQGRKARLHLWVPPTPGDPGVPIGAAWLFAHLAGSPRGAPMTHAFYRGLPPSPADIAAALGADDIASERIGDISTPEGRDAMADLMAFMIAQNGVIALYQGAAETGPRALGHRSILANPRDVNARELLNERVKYREAIRPLAPMTTREAANEYFELLEGASDADYNAYSYMVLTAQSKPHARDNFQP